MFEIEKNVPMPEKKTAIAPVVEKLEVGDSFLAPQDRINAIRSAASRYGYKTKVRKKPGDDKIRVWRVE